VQIIATPYNQLQKDVKMQTTNDLQMYGTPDINLYIQRHFVRKLNEWL